MSGRALAVCAYWASAWYWLIGWFTIDNLIFAMAQGVLAVIASHKLKVQEPECEPLLSSWRFGILHDGQAHEEAVLPRDRLFGTRGGSLAQ